MNNDVTNNRSIKSQQRVLDNLESVVMLFDKNFILEYINPAGEVLFSASTRNMVGQKACDLIHCPEAAIGQNFKEALTSNQAITEREIMLPLPDKSVVMVDCSIIPLFGMSEGEDGFLVEINCSIDI